MKWSWNVGKIAGVDLKIHLTFFLLIGWIGFSTLLNGGTVGAVLIEVLFISALFLCVVLHEFGHALTARRFGIATRDITLLPIGGVARLETMPEDPKEELIVAAAGPLVNVLIGVFLFVGLLISGTFMQPFDLTMLTENFWLRLMTVNISLVVFNLIPAFPMDGGRVLRSILATRMEYLKATRTAAFIGRGLALLMGIAGFFLNPLLILTGIFIWYGAGSEAQTVELKRGLKGLVVRDAMISQFYMVEANQSLDSVFQLAMETGQHNIPVVSNGHFLGIIRRGDLLDGLDRLGNRAPAYAAIGAEPDGLDPEMNLVEVLPKFTLSRVLPVIENRQLIGLITPESLQQRMWLNQRRGSSDQKPPEETVHPA
jgi:Zn-dependent protease